MAAEFAGKVVLVTGAGSGLGRACAEAFARAGAKVVIADISSAVADEAVASIRGAGGEAMGVTCDVSQSPQVDAMLVRAIDKWGRLDIAINNAGVTAPVVGLAQSDECDYDRVMDVNVKGTWLCMRAELRQMLRQGGGTIINMASALSLRSFVGGSIYVASKHAVAGLTRTAAVEYARSGIRINAVCPGIIQTPLIDKTITDPSVIATMSSHHPMSRLGTPAEVASAVLWLASEGASFATGSLLSVDGGWSAT